MKIYYFVKISTIYSPFFSLFQTYKVNTKKYLTRDKYHGRYLDKAGVQREIMDFFHDGVFLRADVIAVIITKLKQLSDVLKLQTAFKLFSCSLLLLYEGATCVHLDSKCESRDDVLANEMLASDSKADVRLIDFANAIPSGVCTEEQNAMDAGIGVGLEHLIAMLEDILEKT